MPSKERLPYCIWDDKNAELYNVAPDHVKDHWERYVNEEARKYESRPDVGVDHCINVMYQWKPPLSFEEWYKLEYRTPKIPCVMTVGEKTFPGGTPVPIVQEEINRRVK